MTPREIAEIVGLVAAVVGVIVLLVKGRYEGHKLEAEAELAETDAEVQAKASAMAEADKIIGWLRLKQEETEKLLEKQRGYYERRLEEQRCSHTTQLNAMRASLESRIDQLARRVDLFGCTNAPNCKRRNALDASMPDEEYKPEGTD